MLKGNVTKIAALEILRVVSLFFTLLLIPTPRSETNEVSIDPVIFNVGTVAFLIFMFTTCLIANRARWYGLISTGILSVILACAVYMGMKYWEIIR